MFYPGLVSISFRALTPDEVIALCRKTGLTAVEWGTDSHVKTPDAAAAAYRAGSDAGVLPCSCGSYYKLGVSPTEDLRTALDIARELHTDTLRIWAATAARKNFPNRIFK